MDYDDNYEYEWDDYFEENYETLLNDEVNLYDLISNGAYLTDEVIDHLREVDGFEIVNVYTDYKRIAELKETTQLCVFNETIH